LYEPRLDKLFYTFTPVTDAVVDVWIPSGQQVHLVELFAGPLALDSFSDTMHDRFVIHFNDNSAALGALVKGYSRVHDNVRIVCDYWLRAASRKLFMYCDRVESKSNISDDPSRLNEHGTMEKMGATFVPPCLSYLNESAPQRDPTTWFGGSGRVHSILESLIRVLPHEVQRAVRARNNPPHPNPTKQGEAIRALTLARGGDSDTQRPLA